ncbi:MAG: hypothetical protein AB1490_06215 [Pseudomonadota bacterium]
MAGLLLSAAGKDAGKCKRRTNAFALACLEVIVATKFANRFPNSLTMVSLPDVMVFDTAVLGFAAFCIAALVIGFFIMRK